MIKIIVGGIGSGKTLSVVKDVLMRKQPIFTNFQLFNIEHTRLRYQHLFVMDDEDKRILGLNYDFWKSQKGGFDIILDEFHNLMASRRSMSKRNIYLSDWLSQIRKILGESERNNLYLLTQKLRRIDINSRDLAHEVVLCRKQVYADVIIDTMVYNRDEDCYVTRKLPLTLIYKYYFAGCDEMNNFELFGKASYYKISRFVANIYYKFYDSYAMVDFGSDEYL